MPLTPVDNDPFAAAPPVKGGKLTPVDHDPFATDEPPAVKMPAALTYDEDPNGGFLSGLHNLAVGSNLFGKKLQDAVTLKGADALQGMLPGQDVKQLRAQTDEAGRQIGPLASGIADVAGYAVGPGKLKIGEGIAGLMGAGRLARVGGSMAEGGLTSGASSALGGDDWGTVGKNATIGTALSALTGLLPGSHGPAPIGVATDDLGKAAKAGYANLPVKNYVPQTIGDALTQVTTNLGAGPQLKMGEKLAGKIADAITLTRQKPSISLDDIADWQSVFKRAARNDVDPIIAQKYVDALNRGIGPQNQAAVEAANKLHSTWRTTEEIDKLLTNPSTAPKQAESLLAKKGKFYPQPIKDALAPVVAAGAPDSPLKAAAKEIMGRGINAAIGGGTSYLLGGGTGADMAAAGIGALVPGYKGRISAAPIRRNLLAARHLASTGQTVDPSVFGSVWPGILSDAARTAGYTIGAQLP